ncbi:MAG: aminoacetone oxidase family FAD-binding enzyme [Clostridiales bacterium]|jgi:predicted Rossmann fold flavoprotein|nr:aminoacetone oxidase family FAD-binding enzyme [Clostridiales bacterium]
MENIAVIGAGASGLMAAVAAGRIVSGAGVSVYERNEKSGKKLLATGNGRCNISNAFAAPAFYHGENPNFVKNALTKFGAPKTLDLFLEMGLFCIEERGGRIFPRCKQSSAVLDALRGELARLNVSVSHQRYVTGVFAEKTGGFTVKTSDGQTRRHSKVIITCGGAAAPSTGSDGGGFKLLSALGHKIVPPAPAICQLKTDMTRTKSLRGVKVNCVITAFDGDRSLGVKAEGDALFTNYGLSGSAVFDISRVIAKAARPTLVLDFFAEYPEEELTASLRYRRERFARIECVDFLTGAVNKNLGRAIMKSVVSSRLSLPASALTDDDIRNAVETLKRFPIHVIGHNGWENAQTTAGGADTRDFDDATMQSRVTPGLYAAGEVLDVAGDCGGFNLQWAWSSGQLAGMSAAE